MKGKAVPARFVESELQSDKKKTALMPIFIFNEVS